MNISKPVDVTRLMDQSGSMAQLVPTMIQTCQDYEKAMAKNMPGSRIKRVLFSDEVQEIDSSFVDPIEAARERPINEFFRANGGTYFYRYFSHYFYAMIEQAWEYTDRRHLLIISTDGKNSVPTALQYRFGDPRRDLIRDRLMPMFWELAVGKPRPAMEELTTDLLNQSNLAVWYQGIGMTEEFHRAQARGIGIPDPWFFHVPATEEGLRYSQHSVAQSSQSFAGGEGTVFAAFNPPQPPPRADSDGNTVFGARP